MHVEIERRRLPVRERLRGQSTAREFLQRTGEQGGSGDGGHPEDRLVAAEQRA